MNPRLFVRRASVVMRVLVLLVLAVVAATFIEQRSKLKLKNSIARVG